MVASVIAASVSGRHGRFFRQGSTAIFVSESSYRREAPSCEFGRRADGLSSSRPVRSVCLKAADRQIVAGQQMIAMPCPGLMCFCRAARWRPHINYHAVPLREYGLTIQFRKVAVQISSCSCEMLQPERFIMKGFLSIRIIPKMFHVKQRNKRSNILHETIFFQNGFSLTWIFDIITYMLI